MRAAAMIPKQAGFSLLEVLITMLVVAIALLGHITLQNRTIAEQQAAFFQSMADTFIIDLSERIAANRTAAIANASGNAPYVTQSFHAIDVGAASASSCLNSACDSATLAAYDLAIWQQGVGAVLPSAVYRISIPDQITHPRVIRLELAWKTAKDGEKINISGNANPCDLASPVDGVHCRVLMKFL